MKLAVVGGGQMGRALVGGMIDAGVLSAAEVSLVEPHVPSQAWWAQHRPKVKLADLSSAVQDSEAVLVAVKPHIVATVLEQSGIDWTGRLVISIAAGLGLKVLGQGVGHDRIVRVMPNTPSLVGAGASGFCCGDGVTEADRHEIAAMLNSVGESYEVTEPQMDGVTGLSGSGPAYVCLMIEALADGGVLAGLPRELAMKLATQTVAGTAKMIAQTEKHPGQLKDAVASPGGTTIAALATLEHNGFRSALIEAVAASARRSRELGG